MAMSDGIGFIQLAVITTSFLFIVGDIESERTTRIEIIPRRFKTRGAKAMAANSVGSHVLSFILLAIIS
jgi:hypothetical protein